MRLIYPPVDCSQLKTLPLEGRENLIVSIAQFRPEKNHMLQLEAFAVRSDKAKGNVKGKDEGRGEEKGGGRWIGRRGRVPALFL